jgi:hypothetical protein
MPPALPRLLVALAVAVTGCAKPHGPATTENAVAKAAPPVDGLAAASGVELSPLPKKVFGAALTGIEPTPLSTLLHNADDFNKKTLRTEGVVSAVCKSMGCWMELADDSRMLHVRMAGHSFFVPKNASGHHAMVEGTVFRPAASDCTEEAEALTGKTAKVELEATGVVFVD